MNKLLEIIREVPIDSEGLLLRHLLVDFQAQAIHDAIVRSWPELEWHCVKYVRMDNEYSDDYCIRLKNHDYTRPTSDRCNFCGARREEEK